MKLLFICTHNRCRSILAEAIANHYGCDLMEARSAGSEPAAEVHPLTLKYLQEAGIPTRNLSSKSWEELEDFEPDLVITVCDNAAGESCPLWLGRTPRIHWGLKDPSAVEGDEDTVRIAFQDTIDLLHHRITLLRHWLGAGPDPAQLHSRIAALAVSQ